MDKWFPRMFDYPEGKQIALGGLYWVAYLVVWPFLFNLLCLVIGGDFIEMVNLNVVFFAINAVIVFLLFREYLVSSFLNVRLDVKRFFLSVALGLLVFCVIEIPILLSGAYKIVLSFEPFPFPMADTLSAIHGAYLLFANPFLMGVSLVVLVPVTVSCLYYGVCFAPACQNRVWLGYLLVAIVSAIPAVLMVTSLGEEPMGALKYYLALLPFHMCACWIYQRTDTIWGPIVFHAIVNLVSFLVLNCMLT